MNKVALIVGITGQDGKLLTKYLSSLNYSIYGITHGQDLNKRKFFENYSNVKLLEADVQDINSLYEAFKVCGYPNEIYNLSAISSVGLSWKQPNLSYQITGLGTVNLLNAIKNYYEDLDDSEQYIKFFQASSSEIFGNSKDVPQHENSKIDPISPYGISKAFAHNNVKMFREAYNMWTCSGILYNHSSFYRSEEFVTKKITKAIARIKLGKQNKLELRDIDHVGDWGYAEDYIKAMHLMLQADRPQDYIISSGEQHSLRDMINVGFKHIGIDKWDALVSYNKLESRPTNTNYLYGDNSKIKNELGWKPDHTFEQWVKHVIDQEVEHEQHSLYYQ